MKLVERSRRLAPGRRGHVVFLEEGGVGTAAGWATRNVPGGKTSGGGESHSTDTSVSVQLAGRVISNHGPGHKGKLEEPKKTQLPTPYPAPPAGVSYILCILKSNLKSLGFFKKETVIFETHFIN